MRGSKKIFGHTDLLFDKLDLVVQKKVGSESLYIYMYLYIMNIYIYIYYVNMIMHISTYIPFYYLSIQHIECVSTPRQHGGGAQGRFGSLGQLP